MLKNKKGLTGVLYSRCVKSHNTAEEWEVLSCSQNNNYNIYIYIISIYFFFNLELLLPPQKSLVAKLLPPTLLTSWYYYIVKFHIKIAVRLFSLPETLLLSFNEGAASFSRGACAGIDQTIYIP